MGRGFIFKILNKKELLINEQFSSKEKVIKNVKKKWKI